VGCGEVLVALHDVASALLLLLLRLRPLLLRCALLLHCARAATRGTSLRATLGVEQATRSLLLLLAVPFVRDLGSRFTEASG